jgi:hypothetical protein
LVPLLNDAVPFTAGIAGGPVDLVQHLVIEQSAPPDFRIIGVNEAQAQIEEISKECYCSRTDDLKSR